MKIFISYRRDDSIVHARLIHNELAARFGEDSVFMDIDDIDYGRDFAQAIDRQLDDADAVVAVIGPRWSELLHSRLHGDDYVRHELARALARDIRIVPVLVAKAPPPGADLPPDLAPLRTLNCLNLDERALKLHITALVETLQGEPFEDVARALRQRIRSARRAQMAGVAAGLAMFFAASVALLEFFGLDTRVASLTMWLGARPPAVAADTGEVLLVGIDETTVQRIGRPFDASWRREHARLIERLQQAGARTVAFDLFFERAGTPADDAALERALRAASGHLPVVFAVHRMDGERPQLLPRFSPWVGWGIACAAQRVGHARSMLLAVERADALHPSLALAAFSGGGKVESIDTARRTLRVRVPRLDRSPDVDWSALETMRTPQAQCAAVQRGDRIALQLFEPASLGIWREPPQRLAYERLVGEPDAAALTQARGKVVLVGLQLPGTDVMSVAAGPQGEERFGIELIAEQIRAIERGDVIRPAGWALHMAVMLGLGLAGAFARRLAAGRSPWVRRGLAAACVLAIGAAVVGAYRSQQVLIGLPYAAGAFLIAWWAMARLERRST